jgi:hypothetical protein
VGSTSSNVVTSSGAPPPAGTRSSRAVCRSVTSASPPGRKVRPHGICSPVTSTCGDDASTPVAVGGATGGPDVVAADGVGLAASGRRRA